MRLLIIGLAGASALFALAGCNKPAPASGGGTQTASTAATPPAAGPLTVDSLPHRKPGLWRQTMVMEGMPQGMPSSEMCVDAASETKMALLGRHMQKEHCQPPQLSRNLDGSITFTGDCDFGAGGRTTTKGTLSGDFNSSYKTVIESTHTGSAAGRADGSHKMTITATWEGPCAPGQKGGDLIMAGGQKMNVTEDQ